MNGLLKSSVYTVARTATLFVVIITAALLSTSASAQMSVQDADGSSRTRFLGSEWNFSFFSLAGTETDRARDAGGRIGSYNFISAATYLDNGLRLALRVPFSYNTAGSDRFNGNKNNNQELFLQDVFVSLQNFTLLFLPWDLGLFWEGRVYLPTSENSKRVGMITRLRNDFILNKVFSQKFEAEYVQKFNFLVQSRRTAPVSFEDEEGFAVNAVGVTKRTELDHWATAWYKYTPQTGFGLRFGAEQTTYNTSVTEGKSKPMQTILKFGPQIRFPLNDRANFILGFDDRIDTDINPQEMGRFLAKNTQLTLLSFVRF
jgi:hypothetical protein